MGQPCSNCTNLQAENTRLQAEVGMLLRIIAGASSECIALMNEAEQTQAGHNPRGVWAHAEGKMVTAKKVLSRLRI